MGGALDRRSVAWGGVGVGLLRSVCDLNVPSLEGLPRVLVWTFVAAAASWVVVSACAARAAAAALCGKDGCKWKFGTSTWGVTDCIRASFVDVVEEVRVVLADVDDEMRSGRC